MQIKCLAIDDEPLALDLIKEYASRIASLKMVQAFDDAISAAEFLRQNKIDLLFIDINMPDITGIELMRSLDQKPLAIFTTAYKQFAYEGFELDAVDYLLKPISFERFAKAVNKAIDYYHFKNGVKKDGTEALFVRSEYQLLKVDLDDIEFIESLDDYIKIHLSNDKPVMTLMTMKALQDKLPEDKFKRIHRSYVVALSKVRSFSNKKVQLASMKELPVSNSYIQSINEWIRK